jgi:HEPN domain-containing protein
MSPIKKKYKTEYAFQLLRIATGDLQSAELLRKAIGGRPENVLYLVQQSIEKSLKAVSCYKTQSILTSHDLEALVASLPEDVKPPQAHLLDSLTPFATVRRYEEGYQVLSEQDLDSALNLGRQINAWAKSLIV